MASISPPLTRPSALAGKIADREFQIEFLGPEIEVFAATFG